VKVLSTPKLWRAAAARRGSRSARRCRSSPAKEPARSFSRRGTSAILQSIQYRDTGVILTVKPNDLCREPDRSRDQAGSQRGCSEHDFGAEHAGHQQPHGSALSCRCRTERRYCFGGLIMENSSSTSSGIPGLKDIPGVGFLFGTQQVAKTAQRALRVYYPLYPGIGRERGTARVTYSESVTNRYPSRNRRSTGEVVEASGLRWTSRQGLSGL